MSRFTFGFLLGTGVGWAVGSGKAAEWKRARDERRVISETTVWDQPDTATVVYATTEGASGVASEFGSPEDVAAL